VVEGLQRVQQRRANGAPLLFFDQPFPPLRLYADLELLADFLSEWAAGTEEMSGGSGEVIVVPRRFERTRGATAMERLYPWLHRPASAVGGKPSGLPHCPFL
jgi:hypothetical protein